jgi:hypothetical protein
VVKGMQIFGNIRQQLHGTTKALLNKLKLHVDKAGTNETELKRNNY